MSYNGPRYTTRREMTRRGKIRHDFGFSDTKYAWKGPVERRDPRHYQQPCVILARCLNRWCALWLATDATRCPHCHERQHPPRSTVAPPPPRSDP